MKKIKENKMRAVEAVSTLFPTSSFKDITTTVMNLALEATGSRHGFVGYIDRYTGHLVVPMLTGEIYPECRVKDNDVVFKNFDNLFGHCITSATPLLTNDPYKETASRGTPDGHIKIERFIGVPAVRSGTVVGMIGVANAAENYGDEDLNAVLRIAEFYGSVIHAKLDNEELLRLSQAVQQVGNGVVITDLAGNIQMVNEAFQKITGYTAKEAMGKNPRILKSGFHTEEYYEDMWGTIVGGKTWSGRFKNKRKDGTDYWTDSIITPIKDSEGKILNYMAIKQDVTERIRAEEALRRSEERLRIITDSAMEAIVMVDNNRLASFWNPAAEKMFGYSENEALGKDFLELVIPERLHEEFKDEFDKFIKSKKSAFSKRSIDIVAVKKNRAEFPMELSVSSLVYEDKWHAVAVGRDITIQKELMRTLKEKNEEMESFVYSVSHDLKSPVVTIEGFINILKDELSFEPGSEVEWSLNRIITATDKMKGMITELLEYSRLDTTEVEKETVSFSAIVDEAMQIFDMNLHRNKVALETKNLDVRITCEKKRIVRVMENLIGNALKYIGDDNGAPAIEIGVKNEYGENVFYVRDNGIGIPKEEQSRVFMLFKRATNAAGKEGTGVGLSMTRKIIEKHGGRIWFDSEQGRGTTFCFTIPG